MMISLKESIDEWELYQILFLISEAQIPLPFVALRTINYCNISGIMVYEYVRPDSKPSNLGKNFGSHSHQSFDYRWLFEM